MTQHAYKTTKIQCSFLKLTNNTVAKNAKGCTRLASDKVYPTTKTGRHDIPEILLKLALNTNIHLLQKYEHTFQQ